MNHRHHWINWFHQMLFLILGVHTIDSKYLFGISAMKTCQLLLVVYHCTPLQLQSVTGIAGGLTYFQWMYDRKIIKFKTCFLWFRDCVLMNYIVKLSWIQSYLLNYVEEIILRSFGNSIPKLMFDRKSRIKQFYFNFVIQVFETYFL